MHILRKMTLWLTGGIFRFLLLTTAIVGTVVMVLGTPVHIKQILKDSNIYGTFVDGVIAEARKNPDTQSNSSLPIDDPVFQKAIKDSFTPEFLQTSTENVVDGTYHWLTGRVTEPDFRIDITAQKQKFANAVGDYAVVKLNALPVCTKQQLLQLQASGNTDIDPFKATCRPVNLVVASQKQKVVSDLLTSKEFLSKTVITADSLTKNQNGKNFFQDKSAIPKAYGWVNLSPVILGVILLLLATAIFFLQQTKRRGARTIGLILTETGIFLGIISLISSMFYKSGSKPGGFINKALGDNSFQQTVSKILSSVSQLVNSRLMLFGLIYAIPGIIILLVLFFTRNKKPKNQAQSSQLVDDSVDPKEKGQQVDIDSETGKVTSDKKPEPPQKPKLVQ